MIDDAVRREIVSALEGIEREEDVRICLAVESGSRAWGFASADSDYDVRFIYVHHPEWYLSIDLEGRNDTIERPIVGELDLSGWDVRKALKLYRKSNPPILEWLQSPTIYREQGCLADDMRTQMASYFSPRACAFHYWHMAQGNWRSYLQGDVVSRKKYLYVLRPLLALRWIAKSRGPVPMEFARLVDATVSENAVADAIRQLVEAKMAGDELDRGPRIGAIGDFIDAEMARVEATIGDAPPAAVAGEDLDLLFRRVLAE